MTCLMMVHLGVYALGAADASESQLVEAHLPRCAACRAELARLKPVTGLLARVPEHMVPGARRSSRPARPRRAAAVAAVVAVVIGLAGGFWLAPREATASPPALTLSGTDAATHVQATAALTGTSWGTSILLLVQGAPLNQPCRLIVRSRGGATEVTGYWDAWSTGPISVPASAGLRPSEIASLQVATAAKALVTIVVPIRAARPAH